MKISEIVLSNYRAFYNEPGKEHSKYRIDLSSGKNLLVYGENGSGKSSLYRGMKDLFRSSVDPDCRVIPNVFSKELELAEQPFVEVAFSEKENRRVFTFSADEHRTNTGDALLKSVARSRSFMTYRDLLRVHFVDAHEVNLFGFLFGKDGLLAELPHPAPSRPETALKIEDLRELALTRPDEIILQDFTIGVNQILTDVNKSLNCLLKYFDESLSITFSEFKEESLRKGEPSVTANVVYFGISLDTGREQYHNFLNEARLSALAICIFLAAHLSVPSAAFEMLFLDDIFTGLDTSNRFPLLKILTDDLIEGTTGDTFIHHQIILTTYDRQWYELARNYLNAQKWSFREFYIDGHTNKFDSPEVLPTEDDYAKAWHYFRTNQYPACANYQRKICENLIKKFLPDNRKYDALSNGDIVPVNKLDTFIGKLEIYLTENNMSFEPFKRLRNCLRVVMNPLSHDDFESPVYRKELDLVFEIIKELQKLKNTVVIDAGKQIKMHKVIPQTGVEREYVCELTTPVRRLENGIDVRLTRFNILPLTQKDGEHKKVKISFGGRFEEVYGRFCHSMGIAPAENPFSDFQLMDNTPLDGILKTEK